MTFATIETHKSTTSSLNVAGSFLRTQIARLNAFRAERKELRSLYHYHSEKTANLEQAKRDVNRVWQGHY